jgi:hypothetical protein
MEQHAMPSDISGRYPLVFRFCPLPALPVIGGGADRRRAGRVGSGSRCQYMTNPLTSTPRLASRLTHRHR